MLTNIPDDIADRLQQLAEQEGRSLGDLLKAMLTHYAPDMPQEDEPLSGPPPGSLAELAQNAREANMESPHPVNTAERSREILSTEYAEYLKRRSERDSDAGADG